MIEGTVVAKQGPVVPLIVYDADGQEYELDALVDTGYTAWLTLPKSAIDALRLRGAHQVRAALADGGEILLNTFLITVMWDGNPLPIYADELDSEPLIGMRLLRGFRLIVEAVDDGLVRIERM